MKRALSRLLNPCSRRVIAAAVLSVVALSCADRQPTAEIVLFNGKVFTADPARPVVEAIAIRDDRILAVGTNAEVDELAAAATRRIDLAGHVAIPGINDAHTHFVAYPAGAHVLPPFSDIDPPWSEVQPAIAAAVRQIPEGTLIRGTVGIRVIADPTATRFALDTIAPNHPVILSTFFGHGDLLNSRMMRELAVGETDPDPPGGFYDRVQGSNRLNGKIFEYAQWRLWRRLADRADRKHLIEELHRFSDQAVRFGITSIQSLPSLSAEMFVNLLTEASLPLRVRVIQFPVTDEKGRSAAEGADLSKQLGRSDRITVSGVKWILDGTPLERGMAIRGEYTDRPGWSGRTNFPPGEIAFIVRESIERDEPLLLHAVGDRTVAIVFDAMDAMKQVDWTTRRLRIEHGDGVVRDLVPRAARHGVIVVQNPTHFALAPIIQARFGPNVGFLRLRSLHEAGVRIALGSDTFGGPEFNPYLNIMLASLHPTAPAEAISREMAVEAYTRNAAYAEFKEQEKGTLERGKLADIAVLSQDIFTVPPTALPATESILTMIGGRVVYDAGKLPGSR
jgi:predicted amidohydrolase YtcJ